MGIAMKILYLLAVISICLSGVVYAQGEAKEPAVTAQTDTSSEAVSDSVQARGLAEAAQSSDRISLDLKGIDILEFFRIVSKKMGITIVPTKSVTGRINIFLNNLSFDDALEVIFISQDLASERKGSIIKVMTAAEYEHIYGEKYNEKRTISTIKLKYAKPATVFNALGQLKSDVGKIIIDESSGTIILIDIPERIEMMTQAVADLDMLPQTRVYDIKYAKAADIKAHLSAAITTGPGELFVDERSGTIIITDLPDKISKIMQVIEAFDQPSPQVMFEAEIIQITLNDEHQRQINWERVFTEQSKHGLDFVGTFPTSPSFSPSPALDTSSMKVSIGTLASDDYTATVKFLDTLGEAKVLSSPRIMALNNQEAKVLVGTREAYITSTQSQATDTTITAENVEFIDVGVKLSICPTVNKDGFITVKIKPEVSRVASTITTQAGSRVPIVETSEAETTVKIKDGVMILIAGLIKEEKRDDASGVPFISRIPLVGALFGSKTNQKKKTELIVFLTPHIVQGDINPSALEIQRLMSPDMVPRRLQDIILREKLDSVRPAGGAAGAGTLPGAAARSFPANPDDGIQSRIKDIKSEG